jgi:hypothetical protein
LNDTTAISALATPIGVTHASAIHTFPDTSVFDENKHPAPLASEPIEADPIDKMESS